jgi:hypothetical protein
MYSSVQEVTGRFIHAKFASYRTHRFREQGYVTSVSLKKYLCKELVYVSSTIMC